MMELIDVLTPDGHPTGTTKPKHEIHRDGDWHRSAHLWIVTPDDRVLLQRRAFAKESWPGMWDVSVAGHIDAGESALDAIIREAHEELGLTIAPHELTHLGTLRFTALLEGRALSPSRALLEGRALSPSQAGPESAALQRAPYIENEFHEVYLLRRDIDLTKLVFDPAEVAEAALVAPEELDAYDVVPHPESFALLRGVLR